MPPRDPFLAPAVASRRGGPAKAPLSREAIVAEALRQLTADPSGSMSLRKVAAALDTGAASLYAYVADLNELQALVLDKALEEVRPTRTKGAWQTRLHALLESYARVLAASPGLARLAFGTIAVGPNALRIVESLLSLLHEAGVDGATAAWAVDLLVLYVTSVAAEHAGGGEPTAPGGAVAQALARASSAHYPRVYTAREQLLSGTGEQRFAWALDVLIRGILHTPVGPAVLPVGALPPQAKPAKTTDAKTRRSK